MQNKRKVIPRFDKQISEIARESFLKQNKAEHSGKIRAKGKQTKTNRIISERKENNKNKTNSNSRSITKIRSFSPPYFLTLAGKTFPQIPNSI